MDTTGTEKRLTSGTEYYRRGKTLMTYVRAAERTDAFCVLGSGASRIKIPEISNRREPYDFRTHIFELDEAELRACGSFEVGYTRHGNRPTVLGTLRPHNCSNSWCSSSGVWYLPLISAVIFRASCDSR